MQTGRDYSNDSITENGQNTEKSPKNLRRLAVTQIPVKNHQIILMRKTLKKYIIIIQRGIFQGYALSPLLVLIAMMPLDHILRKSTGKYKLSRL